MLCWILRKHKWDYRLDSCARCKKTATAIVAGAVTTGKLVENEVYWRGVEAGYDAARKTERSRAYRVGFRRGAREMHVHVMKALKR